ncbi:hypothetical protein Tco_0610048 [Tanacetum coccineum]
MLQARENLMEAIQAFLKKYDQIPPEEKSMAVLLAEEIILKAMQTLEEKPESMQELLLQFSKDLQTLDENSNQLKQEEQETKVSSQYWKPPIYHDNDDDDEESSIHLRDIISELPLSEFTGKLAPIDPIPPGIVKAYPEEDIRLIENLLNDESFPHSLEEHNSEIPDAIIRTSSPNSIPLARG